MTTQSRQGQGGFTLIELVIVIVVLGILAAVAVPRFIDLTDEAAQASVEGVAGALASASAINYGAAKAGSGDADTVENCTEVGALLVGGLPAGYTIEAAAVAADVAVECTVTGPEGNTATFQAIGVD